MRQTEYRDDNDHIASELRQAHATCDPDGDYASVSLLENCIAASCIWVSL
jgi:hypothetical protein